MKTLGFIIMLCVFCAPCWAQARFVDIAPELGVAWTQGDFTQIKTIAGLPLPLRSSGEFSLQGDHLLWLTKEPFSSELQFSSQAISQWQEGVKRWEMTAQQQPVITTISQLMMAMMAANWVALDQAFRVDKFDRDESACWSLIISSTDPVLASVVDSLLINGCERVRGIELREVSGNLTQLDFSASKQGEH